MDQHARPFRSLLYIPGSRERALEKARSLPADAIIFDLEDAVLPEEKGTARSLLADWLARTDYGPRLRILRINGFDTPWGRADAAAFALCRENKLPIVIFDLMKNGNIGRAVRGETIGTLVA